MNYETLFSGIRYELIFFLFRHTQQHKLEMTHIQTINIIKKNFVFFVSNLSVLLTKNLIQTILSGSENIQKEKYTKKKK